MKKFMQQLMLGLICLTFLGCTSTALLIPTAPPAPDEVVLGPTEGESTGIMLFQFIPIKQNDRFQVAYDKALKSKGATRLVNPTIEERWFWAFVLNGYNFKVSGTAVKQK